MPATGRYCLATLMSSDRTKQICLWMTIYIDSHSQTDCFILSELFSVARHVGRSKPGSKPIQLYVRLSVRPLGQQTYHVWLRELLRYLCSNSSSCSFTFLYPIGYQSAQFFRRARDNFGKFIHQFQTEIKTLIWKISFKNKLINK